MTKKNIAIKQMIKMKMKKEKKEKNSKNKKLSLKIPNIV